MLICICALVGVQWHHAAQLDQHAPTERHGGGRRAATGESGKKNPDSRVPIGALDQSES
jgi:hypothetical protein